MDHSADAHTSTRHWVRTLPTPTVDVRRGHRTRIPGSRHLHLDDDLTRCHKRIATTSRRQASSSAMFREAHRPFSACVQHRGTKIGAAMTQQRLTGARARRARATQRKRRFHRNRVIAAMSSVAAALCVGVVMRVYGPAGASNVPTSPRAQVIPAGASNGPSSTSSTAQTAPRTPGPTATTATTVPPATSASLPVPHTRTHGS